MTDSTTDNGNYPPKPNPMVLVNPYPRPADGTPNLPALRAVRDFITSIPTVYAADHDDAAPDDGVAWSQGDWRCGSGMCFAGWAGALTGAVFPYAADDSGSIAMTAGDIGWALKRVTVEADGKTWHIQSYATYILGLDSVQARYLFDGSNDIDRIDDVISAIEDGRPVTDADDYSNDDDADED